MKPLILVVNDDGITAPGIRELIDVMMEFGQVVVVAPDSPQSGMGHAITLNNTLRAEKVNYGIDSIEEFSCTGTPVDCVKLAVNNLLPRKPDLIVSGINHGSNSSINVIYSGTMSAAMEGALEGIPSIGFSLLDTRREADFSVAKEVVRVLVRNVLENGMPQDICLNVNIPVVSQENLKGIKVCRQAKGNWEEEFDERLDPNKRSYYWLTGSFVNYDKGEDTDIWALENKYVSVVPVQFDLTAHHSIQNLNTWNYEF